MNSEEFTIKIKEYLDYADDFLDSQTNFPVKIEGLICIIQEEFKFKDAEKRKVDTIIRMYMSDHDKYKIFVGVGGGIRPKETNKIPDEYIPEIEKRVAERIKKLREASVRATSSILDIKPSEIDETI